MYLVDHQIAQLCKGGMISPYNPELLNPASLDVTLGDRILTEAKDGGWYQVCIKYYTKEDPFWLYPKDFVLLELAEILTLPNNICAQFLLKSSRARNGYNHSLAGWIDNSYHGVLTLEIENLRNNARLPLYPGLRIGQLIFSQTEIPDKSYDQVGRYHGDMQVQASKG